ncbi:hypothetical protein [Paenibacillus sp. P32E]|uniref:hypothetical protein n=1 Tax=Paenibacillus sp. P32E TaxID=1349434 RepID=UPI0015C192AA|nr:hypothetical protein [Paenibacillus sp. P32E]
MTETYRRQANVVRMLGIPSNAIFDEIKQLRKELKVVDSLSIGNEPDTQPVKVPAKRKKAPWRCSNPECRRILPEADKIMHKKRHYCSVSCLPKDKPK